MLSEEELQREIKAFNIKRQTLKGEEFCEEVKQIRMRYKPHIANAIIHNNKEMK